LIVLTWLDRRDVLRVHARDEISNPMQGVFNTRSANRPNPIGLHKVKWPRSTVGAIERGVSKRSTGRSRR
jgi:tRNA (Thr-GGU) A37 N-methylase